MILNQEKEARKKQFLMEANWQKTDPQNSPIDQSVTIVQRFPDSSER